MSVEQWPSVSQDFQRLPRYCKGSIWADPTTFSHLRHLEPVEDSLVQDSEALSAQPDALSAQPRPPLPPPPSFPPPVPFATTSHVALGDLSTANAFAMREAGPPSLMVFQRHEDTSQLMSSQLDVSLRELLQTFHVPEEDANDAVVAASDTNPDSESTSEIEPEPENYELCCDTTHVEVHGTSQGEATHHNADLPCQLPWIYFSSHPMTAMCASGHQGTVLPMYASAPQMTAHAWQCQRHDASICSASSSAWVSPDMFPCPPMQQSIQSFPPGLHATTRSVASTRMTNVNVRQKTIRPKSCHHNGKGNTRKMKDIAFFF